MDTNQLLKILGPLLRPYPAPFSYESAEIDAGGHMARGIELMAFAESRAEYWTKVGHRTCQPT